MFSGGSYDEVARWLRNFLASHAKRVDPRIEAALDAGDARAGVSFRPRLTFAGRETPVSELDYREVAAHRGSLAWCSALAELTRSRARELLASAEPADARAR